MRRACSSAVSTHMRSNQIEENRARKQSKIQCMSDSADFSDPTDSDDSQITVPQRRASRAGPARDARSKKRQTEAARRNKLSQMREKEESDALMDQEWSKHEISQPNFQKLSDAESLYEAAILIIDSEKRNKIALSTTCSVRIEAVDKAINFIRIMEQRNPIPLVTSRGSNRDHRRNQKVVAHRTRGETTGTRAGFGIETPSVRPLTWRSPYCTGILFS